MSTYRLNMWQILQIECWRHHVVIVILKYPILLRSTVKHVFTHRYRLIAPNGENKALSQGKMHVNNNNTDIRIGVSASWIWYVVSWVKTNYMHTNNSSSHYKLLVLRDLKSKRLVFIHRIKMGNMLKILSRHVPDMNEWQRHMGTDEK